VTAINDVVLYHNYGKQCYSKANKTYINVAYTKQTESVGLENRVEENHWTVRVLSW